MNSVPPIEDRPHPEEVPRRVGAPAPAGPLERTTIQDRMRGMWTVASVELRTRARASRWKVLLAVWVVVIYGIVGLTWVAVGRHLEGDQRGYTLYGVTLFFIMGMALLVVPALSATAINADRESGLLATTQVTLLGPGEIVAGKLLAAVMISAVLLVSVIPVFAFVVAFGGVPFGRAMLALLCYFVCLAVVCAIGLYFSSRFTRPVASVAATYLAVATMTIINVIVFVLTLSSVTETPTLRFAQEDWQPEGPSRCVVTSQRVTQVHTERTWWLLAPNPFVVIADAAPASNDDEGADPLSAIRQGARLSRRGPEPVYADCAAWQARPAPGQAWRGVEPVWPTGLTVLLGIGALSLWRAARRLRTPITSPTPEVRIA